MDVVTILRLSAICSSKKRTLKGAATYPWPVAFLTSDST